MLLVLITLFIHNILALKQKYHTYKEPITRATPYVSEGRRPRWCSLTFDYGFCFGSLTRWYYDPIWKVCKERIYSGCGGNKNNFYNKEQCESICTYQMGALKSKSKKKDRVKKILIINPIGATSKRGKSQQSTTKLWKVTSNKTQ
ncbi:unnamed protein product [Pieris brassicae]|uniref:BPTI/Kunitz inhibitor domain-containing protein n=1 Tax=Pieris brassicae TaxID=7116 RepID=A0A9P0X3X4_PIEBR|nr:unnamed protein product [Pieris brassicae]